MSLASSMSVQAMPALCYRRPAAAVLFAMLLASAAGARAADRPAIPEPLAAGEPGTVTEIVDGDTVFLDDGREVRLVGIQAPKLPLGRAGFEPWPLSSEAKAALAELAKGQRVIPAYGGRRMDRHERKLAHLFRADGTWLQAAMLRRGMARVYSFADNRALIRKLQDIERVARGANKGIWAKPYYRIRTTEEARNDIGSFQLVMGRVRDTAKVDGRVYLNFGQNWRTDFTVTIPAERVGSFTDAELEPLALKGRWIRVRGWLESYNGPMIEATHPEQIEVMP
jgi:endonuclease YncB( thermonuclease family)